MIIHRMLKDGPRARNRKKYTRGICPEPNCGQEVYENTAILDDCFAVWWGKCPYCEAISVLDITDNTRGYDSEFMKLCLPTEEEVIMNGLPADIPTRGWADEKNRGKSRVALIKKYGEWS